MGPLAGARERLWRLVAELKAGDPLDPVTVVVPTTYAALNLRQETGRFGLTNVRFVILARLSELLGAPALSAQNRRPMTHLLEASGVRTVAAEAEGPLASTRDHPQTRRSLRNTFRQLRHASLPALVRLTDGPSVPAETVRLYRRFRELTAQFYDREELATSAALSVRDGQATGLDEMGPVVVYLVHDFSPGERELVEALAGRSSCTLLLGLTGDPEADRPLQATARRLSPAFGPPEQWPDDPRPTSSQLVVAPNGQQEVRWAIRHIIQASPEGSKEGVPFHRMAVLYRKTDPYGVLVREEMELAGLPVAGPDTTPLAQRAAGRTLLGLLKLSTGELSRDEVMTWLTSCPIRSTDRTPGAQVSPTEWDLISRKAGIVRGLDQWMDRLDRFSARVSELASRSAELGETSEAKVTGMVQQARASQVLKEFMTDLAERVKPPRNGGKWREFSRWAFELMQAYFDHRADLPPVEADSEQRVTEMLQELEGADHLEPAPSLATFVQAIQESLDSAVGHLGQTGQGVFVGPLGSAVGLEFDLVHIVGMVEGAVPPKSRDDPLVPDRDRRRAGGQAHGLPLQQAHRAEERYDYLAALATGRSYVLSYPVSDPIGGRAQYPSRWFLEEAAALEGAPVYTSTLDGMSHRPWLSRIASVESSLETRGAEKVPADIHDYDLGSIWQWRRAGRRVSQHPLVQATHLAGGFELDAGRLSQRLTRWDGDVSAIATDARRIDPTDRPSSSPSSLERWARCPFSYLLGSELKLGALERPEDITTISPAEKGLLIHRILEQFFSAALEQGTFPSADRSWNEDQRETLHRIADKAFGGAESSGATGKALLWGLERRDILSDLDSFLEADSRLRERFGTATSHVEARFGMADVGPAQSWPGASIDLPDGSRLRFHGLIDRVDVTASGREALVIDYKTGRAGPYSRIEKDRIDRGMRLQLPVYSLAARAALGEDVGVRAAYWFVSEREGFKLAPPEPVPLDDVLAQFDGAVSTIVSGIREGLFPANPGHRAQGSFENCRYCDFDSLCPANRDVSWRRKKADPRLSRYRELAGPDDEGQGESAS